MTHHVQDQGTTQEHLHDGHTPFLIPGVHQCNQTYKAGWGCCKKASAHLQDSGAPLSTRAHTFQLGKDHESAEHLSNPVHSPIQGPLTQLPVVESCTGML